MSSLRPVVKICWSDDIAARTTKSLPSAFGRLSHVLCHNCWIDTPDCPLTIVQLDTNGLGNCQQQCRNVVGVRLQNVRVWTDVATNWNWISQLHLHSPFCVLKSGSLPNTPVRLKISNAQNAQSAGERDHSVPIPKTQNMHTLNLP